MTAPLTLSSAPIDDKGPGVYDDIFVKGGSPWFDAYAFAGSGNNDNARANAAMAAAKAQGGGTVFFGPIGRDWVLDSISVPSNIRICGAGIQASKLLLTPGAPDLPVGQEKAIFYNELYTTLGDDNIFIDNMTLDGNYANNQQHEWIHGIAMNGIRTFDLHNVKGQNWRGELAVIGRGYSVPQNTDVNMHDIWLYNCGFIGSGGYNNRQGLAVISGDRVNIENIFAKKIASFIVDFESDFAPQTFNLISVRNIFGEEQGGGVNIAAATQGSRAYVNNVQLKGDSLDDLSWGVLVGKMNDVVIDGLNIGISTALGNPITVQDGTRAIIKGLFSQSHLGSGIQLLNQQRTLIGDCFLGNSNGGGSYGIQEVGTSDYTQVLPTNWIDVATFGRISLLGPNSRAQLPQYLNYFSLAAASTIYVPYGCEQVQVGGAGTIDNIVMGDSTNHSGPTAQYGQLLRIDSGGGHTFKDGTGNMKLNGDMVMTADDTLTLHGMGGTWHEVARSVN
jgi:hypothetical protein